ncbi:hypothetical protein FRC12_007317 [Ceratobasidium sp. 428]|nr:hypothetical protein FRC12_007317 [Ceratobasidium sp. 428]
MPKAVVICTFPQCYQQYPSNTKCRAHIARKHAGHPDPERYAPRSFESPPTPDELKALVKELTAKTSRTSCPPPQIRTTSTAPPTSENAGQSQTPPIPHAVDDLSDSFPVREHATNESFFAEPNTPGDYRTTCTIPWFDKSNYNKIVDADGLVRYVHRTAGRILRKERTSWEKLLARRKEKYPNSPWFPFASEAEWKLGYWLATCKSSQSKIDELLAMEGVLAESPNFNRACNLFSIIENDLEGFGGPEWFSQQIPPEHFPGAKEDNTLFFRHVEECLDCLIARPDLAGNITFHPEVVFAGDDEIQVFSEMPTGQLWRELMERAGQHPDAAMGGVLFGSDATHLSHYSGDVKVHALYVSLGNIAKDVRAQTSKRAWMLLAYIPICKWEATLEHVDPNTKSEKQALPGILSRRLFHLCMEIITQPLWTINTHEVVDPEGNVRLVFYVLVAYLADLEEQYLIAALDQSNCIHCTATSKTLGSPDNHPTRTFEDTLAAIERVRQERGPNIDPYKFSLGCAKERLCDVEYPFWARLPLVDICQALSVDLLHGFHKFFFDHPFRWNTNSLTEEKMDARIKAQVPYSGGRMFPRGVTHISQMSGKEYRAIQETHLSVMAHSGQPYAVELTKVTRALLDFMYYAQLPVHTEHTLKAFEAAHDEFHKLKDVWIKNGARRGKTEPIKHFNIPKLHNVRHITDQIRAKGSADNFTTETIEHLHIDTIKEAYPATNKKDWEKQTIRWLTRREKLIEFLLFHTWRKRPEALADSAIAAKGVGDGNVGDVIADNGTDRGENVAGGVATESPEPAVHRHRRGGFAAMVVSNPESSGPVPTPQVKPKAVGTKKRKRQIDDPDDSEERCAKRIERVQQAYGLSQFHDMAVVPTETTTLAEVQTKYGLPTLLDDCKAAHLVPASTSLQAVVEVWKSARVQQPPSRFFPKPDWIRVHAAPPTDKEPAVADPVLYVEGRGNGQKVDRSRLRLQDCRIGRLRLIFRLPPSTPQTPAGPVFAYIHNFLSLPPRPENTTNMYVVTKPACLRPQIAELSDVIRLCPLAPLISGPGIPGVLPQTSLDKYSSFYVNKYRSISDFVFCNNITLQSPVS